MPISGFANARRAGLGHFDSGSAGGSPGDSERHAIDGGLVQFDAPHKEAHCLGDSPQRGPRQLRQCVGPYHTMPITPLNQVQRLLCLSDLDVAIVATRVYVSATS